MDISSILKLTDNQEKNTRKKSAVYKPLPKNFNKPQVLTYIPCITNIIYECTKHRCI